MMKKQILYLFFAFLIILSCNNDDVDIDRNGESKWDDTSVVLNKPKDFGSPEDYKNLKYKADIDTNVYIKGFNLEKTMNFYFSNSESQDVFKVVVKGFKIYSSQIEFTITNKNGKQIYYDNFPSTGVLSNAFDGGGEFATDTQKDEYLRKWIVTFLSNESFLTPAIHKEREYIPSYSNQIIWDAIAADENSIGFVYSKNLSSQTEIAFDKKLNKVVTYYEY